VAHELDPATAAELRQLRAVNRRQAQELEILKKAIAIFSQTPDQ
jgi:transposase